MDLVLLGVALVLAGLAVVVAALLSQGGVKGSVKGAGVVLVGPIPIVFGSDAKWASVAIVLAVVLVILSLIYYVW